MSRRFSPESASILLSLLSRRRTPRLCSRARRFIRCADAAGLHSLAFDLRAALLL